MSMDRLSAVLSRFAGTMLGEISIQAMLDLASREAADLLPVDGAGIVLAPTVATPEYLAASDSASLRFEHLQSSLGQGPCFIARETRAPFSIADLTLRADFPEFAAAAHDLGLSCTFAIPLRHGDTCVGVLDLYRMSPGTLSEDEMNAALTLAGAVAAYVGNAQTRVAREAMSTRDDQELQTVRALTEEHDLVIALAHDLGSPLASIAGFTWLLENAPDELSDTQRRLVSGIHRNSDELGALATDLLSLLSLGPGARTDRAEVDLGALVAAARDHVVSAPAAPEVDLVVHLPESPVAIRGDREHLKRMISNLVSNALKYTPPGGTVSCLVRQEDGHAILEVRDNGIGIPADDMDHLFTSSFRASNAKALGISGTGFGLAIVRSVVQGHDGTITVFSALGSGTRVVVGLPVITDAEPPGT